MQSLPILLYAAIGMVMRISVNINPSIGLFNQQKGKIVDILYPDNDENSTNQQSFGKYNLITKSGSSISSFPIIILDIPDYNGPLY
jgi:hypothetical protein